MKLLNILNEKDKFLKKKCKDVVFPMEDYDKNLIEDMIEYLKNTQMEDIATKYDLRPGMGLAANQLGRGLNYFVVVLDKEENLGDFDVWVVINPKIISSSKELIYAEYGEGCLSIERDVEGIVLRNARITVECYDIDGNKQTFRVREDIAIAFQHEMDHLNGILFTSKTIKETNNIKETIRSI